MIYSIITFLFVPINAIDQTNFQFPCISQEDRDKRKGIFYIKVPKTSSSTLARITERFAGREAKRQGHKDGSMCKVHNPMKHNMAYNLKCNERDKENSFLWSMIRHPDDRAISHYGMRMGFGDADASFETFVDQLENKSSFIASFIPNIQLRFLTTDEEFNNLNKDNFSRVVRRVVEEYNFIGIYERLHESLVVLSMLIGGDVSDVLYDFRPTKTSRCGSLKYPDWVSKEMLAYIQSPRWFNMQKGDFMLYEAVNRRLDWTIDMLGKEKFKKEFEKFERLINIGTDFSKKLMKQEGCGVKFSNPFGDLNELKGFDKLSFEDQQYVIENTKASSG